MASQPGAWYAFPWEGLGCAKYVVLAPFVVALACGWDDADSWSWHMLALCALRYLHAQLWNTAARTHAVSAGTRITAKPVEFKQVDRESNWDDYILLQALVMTAVHNAPGLGFGGWPAYSGRGLVQLLLFHAGPTEFAYYWLHRALHWHPLYQRYHSHHHASFVAEPITGSVHPFAEHLAYTANFAIPLLGTWAAGGASWAMFYSYLLGFDLLNAIGHCNFEFVPTWLFQACPPLKYLIYTPTFHALHHSQVKTNFCLFMPLYDHVYGTADPASDSLHASAMAGAAVPVLPADCVFLAHGTEVLSLLHLPFACRSLSAHPWAPPALLYLLWPLVAPLAAAVALLGRVFTADKHSLGALRLETWVTPAFGVQFFFAGQRERLNAHIRGAIADADRLGVKVIGLGALNKQEALNGGGALFVGGRDGAAGPQRVRVVHGNTLTAAAVLQKIPAGTRRCFLTGATSKLGRAVALYLSAKGVEVRMLTSSTERYEAIVQEAATPVQRALLRRATSCAEGADCDVWVAGKHLNAKEQACAPPGATFHQFVVPPLREHRPDCAYTDLPAFRLPREARGFRSCEMTMARGCVHACHAGALVHALEGWSHHEVGAVPPERIDTVWMAAAKQGFTMV